MLTEPDEGNNLDIYPMHAGLNQWNSGGEEEEEEGEWEEADVEEDTTESVEFV